MSNGSAPEPSLVYVNPSCSLGSDQPGLLGAAPKAGPLGEADQAVGALYVHVPFCVRKCAYCAFYSEPPSEPLMSRYVAALVRELELVAGQLQPRTIYFGGGTPSLLSIQHWERVFEAMGRLGLRGVTEWTIECNPESVSLDKARLWRAAGINRASLGAQAMDDRLLQRLGRIHTRQMVFQAFDRLRQAGFDNINLDLMFAIPGQSLVDWTQGLAEALSLQSEHLSAYELTYEEHTTLAAQLYAGLVQPDADLAADMYEALCERCAEAGLVQYEVSNFARPKPGQADPELPGWACWHNVNYWRGGAYHGLGPSAAGYVRGVRTQNCADIVQYCQALERGCRAIESADQLPPLRRAGEIAAFGLRMTAGWPFELFTHVTGFDLRREWASEMTQLVRQGWACWEADRFRLTRLGLRFADAAAELFLR